MEEQNGDKDFIGENTDYDKKERLEVRKPKSWLKSVSAFANGSEGKLIFGVSDNDEYIGVKDVKGDAEKISEIIKTKMDPIPPFSFSFPVEEGRRFLLLNVEHGDETPYYFAGDGMRIAYIRVGNESIPADSIALKRLILGGSRISYDSVVSRARLADFSFTKLRSVYKNRTGQDFNDSDFVSFELADGNGFLTNAGILMSDEPKLRHCRVVCTRWNGMDKASGIVDALDDHEFTGSLISLMMDSESFVRTNTKKQWKKLENSRIEYPEYPERAVHECLVNALIHRDYLEVGSEVHVDIFDNRLEIYSPGGMPDGSVVQNLDINNIASRRRNPIIADLFTRLNFMERRGSGFRKIVEDYIKKPNYREGLKPVFYSDATNFKVTLYNLNYSNDENTIKEMAVIGGEMAVIGGDFREKLIMCIKDNPKASTSAISEKLAVSKRTIERNIKELRDSGVLIRHGSAHGGYWEVLLDD